MAEYFRYLLLQRRHVTSRKEIRWIERQVRHYDSAAKVIAKGADYRLIAMCPSSERIIMRLLASRDSFIITIRSLVQQASVACGNEEDEQLYSTLTLTLRKFSMQSRSYPHEISRCMSSNQTPDVFDQHLYFKNMGVNTVTSSMWLLSGSSYLSHGIALVPYSIKLDVWTIWDLFIVRLTSIKTKDGIGGSLTKARRGSNQAWAMSDIGIEKTFSCRLETAMENIGKSDNVTLNHTACKS
ncbi:hypothetical protein K435DRAFT_810636 [Dendrothele bispora CBS 962.96]|uniref:Uncharacterized protein n=1 Tax=Dendrothele bispora (strain CBS 962.96) TaxID=1314807 RepID=A0A4S8KUL0_DENBC|nr:hypothetical protein K435DRAFT_810636 [Dendrothele bispora CBS 962.96]